MTKTCGICHRHFICPGSFCNHHFCACGAFFSISCSLKHMYCRMYGPCLALSVGFFSRTLPGVDRTSYLSLFNCRFRSDGCIHLPQAQYTMPVSQFQEQSRRCIIEKISHSSKHSVSPVDFPLNGLNSSILFKSSVHESRFGLFSNC